MIDLEPKSESEIEITGDKLMIPKSKAMSQYWGDDKQKMWGRLTYAAIEIAALKLKNGEFKDFSEFLKFMADYRKTIGFILDHDSGCGKIRETTAFTPMVDLEISQYRDQFPEFSAFIEELESLSKKGNENVRISEEDVTLTGSVPSELELYDENNNRIKDYDRTKIIKSNGQYVMHHTFGPGFMAELQLAEKAFDELKNSDLNEQERKHLINQILFYVADAMPLDRGAASVSQMMFHALEKCYLGKCTYFGKTGSSYGKQRGLQCDIAVMLSPNCEFFEKYLNDNILDLGIKVIDIDSLKICQDYNENFVLKDKEELKNDIKTLYSCVSNFITKVSNVRDEHIKRLNEENDQVFGILYKANELNLYNRRIERATLFIEALKNLYSTLSSTDESAAYLIQFTFESLLKSLVKEKTFYPIFYRMYGTKGQNLWPQHVGSITIEPIDKEKRIILLKNFSVSMHEMNEFFNIIMPINDNFYKGTDIYCKKINSVIEHYKINGKESLNDMIEILQYDCAKNSKYQEAISNYRNLLHQLKNLQYSKPSNEKIVQCFENMILQICPNADIEVQNKLNQKLLFLYKNIDTILDSMDQSHIMWQQVCPKCNMYKEQFYSEQKPENPKQMKRKSFTPSKDTLKREDDLNYDKESKHFKRSKSSRRLT